MTILASDLYTEINQRVGPFSALISVPSVSAWAMREMGYPTVNTLKVVDADLSPVCVNDFNELCDYVQYAASERILDNIDNVSLQRISITEDVKECRKVWRERCEHLLKKLEKRYGYGLPELSEGSINMHFQARRHRRDDYIEDTLQVNTTP